MLNNRSCFINVIKKEAWFFNVTSSLLLNPLLGNFLVFREVVKCGKIFSSYTSVTFPYNLLCLRMSPLIKTSETPAFVNDKVVSTPDGSQQYTQYTTKIAINWGKRLITSFHVSFYVCSFIPRNHACLSKRKLISCIKKLRGGCNEKVWIPMTTWLGHP